jgi:hypothetical protein
MYEPITVEIDRGYGHGTYLSHTITFTGRLVRAIEEDYTTMRLYEWADRGRLVYLVHVEEDQHPLGQGHAHEGIHRRGSLPCLPGIRHREVSWSSPKFANEVGGAPERGDRLPVCRRASRRPSGGAPLNLLNEIFRGR